MTPSPDDLAPASDLTSLFVVSLPRSLSSRVYQDAVRLLGLRSPLWTTSGEILNIDRMAAFTGIGDGGGEKFTHPLRNPLLAAQLCEFLDHVAQPKGYAYKDVIQPLVVARWPRLQTLKVLRINRPVPDVAYAMLHKGWHYPTAASLNLLSADQRDGRPALLRRLRRSRQPSLEVLVADVVEGLVRARRSLNEIPAATVEFDDLITNPRALVDALESLYPGVRVGPPPPPLRDTPKGLAVLHRRETPAYREIEEVVRECERKIPTA